MYLKSQLQAGAGGYGFGALSVSLNAAIDKNPQMTLAYMARGDIYKEKKNYQKAADDFLSVTKLEPYNFNANFKLGLMCQYLKRFADAVEAYQKAVEIRPLDPQANMNLAMVYTQMGQPLRGLPYAQRAVQGDAESPTANANLGILYAQMGYTDASIESLKKSIELNSRQPEVYINLGQEYIKAGKFDQAKNVLETVCEELSPGVGDLRAVGIVLLQSCTIWTSRGRLYNDALRQDPNYYQRSTGWEWWR